MRPLTDPRWIAAGLLLAAAALRFPGLGGLPLGLQHDEAAYGLDAWNLLSGDLRVYYERSNGREPFFIYLLASSFGAFGVGVWQMRLVSAVVGVATVALCGRLFRDMAGARAGLLAMGLVGLSYWPVHVSHTAFRAVTLPLAMAALAWAFWRWWRHGGLPAAAVAGALAGGTVYTYSSARVVPLLLALWLVAAWRLGRASLRDVAAMLAAFVVVAAPLGAYFVANPDAALLRSAQVNDFRPILADGDFRPLLQDAANTAGMIFLRGDESWKYNLSGQPVFAPWWAAAFVLGVGLSAGWALRGGRDHKLLGLMLLSWVALLLLPAAISGESPHFLRTIGALPAIFGLAALGADAAMRRVPRAGAGFAALGLAVLAFATWQGHFQTWLGSETRRDFFRDDYAALDRLLATTTPRPLALAAEYPYDLDPQTMGLIRGRNEPMRWFDARTALLIPAVDGLLVNPRFVQAPGLPGRPLSVLDGLSLYRTPDIRQPDLETAASLPVGSALRFLGATKPAAFEAGITMTVTLGWEALGPGPADLSFSVKLLGPLDTVWSQHDQSPVPPTEWRTGDRFFVDHVLPLDAALAPGVYRLEAQVYRRDTLAPERAGSADRIDLGAVPIARARLPLAPPLRETTEAVFGERIALLGYVLDKTVLAAGETLTLTPYWRSFAAGLPDLAVFAHLVRDDEPDRLFAQRDSQPVYGAFPTTEWRSGDVIRDRYDIVVPADSPAGAYRVALGLYDRKTGARWPVAAPPAGPQEQLTKLLSRLWAPYVRERVESDRVSLKPVRIERR